MAPQVWLSGLLLRWAMVGIYAQVGEDLGCNPFSALPSSWCLLIYNMKLIEPKSCSRGATCMPVLHLACAFISRQLKRSLNVCAPVIFNKTTANLQITSSMLIRLGAAAGSLGDLPRKAEPIQRHAHLRHHAWVPGHKVGASYYLYPYFGLL